jgi:PAS domain-containing protein
MKGDNPDIVALIAEIYESIGDDNAFEETVVKILRMTGSRAAQYGVFDRKGRWLQARSAGVDPSLVNSYLKNYELNDPRTAGWLARPGQFVPCQETVSDPEGWYRSPMVHEYLDKVDSRYALASITPINPELSLGFGMMRARRDNAYGKDEIEKIAPLLPHLVRAMALQVKLGGLESKIASLETIVERLATPVFWVDRTGNIIFVNRAGQEALRRGNYLVLRNGRVEARNPNHIRQLANLMASLVAEDFASNITISRRTMRLVDENARVAMLSLYPVRGLPRLVGQPEAQVILFLTFMDSGDSVDESRLQALFGLTPAETRLAWRLVRGEGLPEIAKRF